MQTTRDGAALPHRSLGAGLPRRNFFDLQGESFIAVLLVEEAHTSQTCSGTLIDGTHVFAVLQTGGGACIAARLVVSQRIGMGWAVPTFSRSTIPENGGMSSQRCEKYRYPQCAGSVAAWTQRIPLGFQPSGGIRPGSCSGFQAVQSDRWSHLHCKELIGYNKIT